MKRKIQQFEIQWDAPESFALVPLQTQDGERITKEQQKLESEIAQGEKQYRNLFDHTV